MKIRRIKSEGEISAASISDLAFLLIIFFIVTATFTFQKSLDLVLPSPNSPIKKVLAPKLLIIKIEENKIEVNKKAVSLENLKVIIKEKVILLTNEKLHCSVEISPRAFYGQIIEVLDMLRENKVDKIALKTMEK